MGAKSVWSAGANPAGREAVDPVGDAAEACLAGDAATATHAPMAKAIGTDLRLRLQDR